MSKFTTNEYFLFVGLDVVKLNILDIADFPVHNFDNERTQWFYLKTLFACLSIYFSIT